MELNNQTFFRISFPSPPVKRAMRWVEIPVDTPLLCPVCGSKDVTNSIRLGASNLGFASVNRANWFCIKVWVCREHEKIKTPPVRKLRGSSIIYEYFQDQSVIHAARQDWAEEFRAKNLVNIVVAGWKPFDVNSVALTKIPSKLLIGWGLSLIMMFLFIIVTRFVEQSSWALNLVIACGAIMLAFILAFIILMIYLAQFKLPFLREMDYFNRRLGNSWRDYLRDPMTDYNW